MDIIFFGSDDFAVPSLEALVSAGYNICSVVTQPDREKGRGLHLKGTAVKLCAKKLNLKIFQPQDINSAAAIKALKALNPDLFVVIAYGRILSKEVLAIPKTFAVNIHASLLPKYRGAAPINWALIRGEKTCGVTAIKMTEKMDAGAVILQEKSDIGALDTAASLSGKLSLSGAGVLIKTVKSIENNNYKLAAQNEKEVSFAPKLKKEDGLIRWAQPAQEIHNLIRGCYNWPGAFTYYKGKLLKIFKADVCLSLEDQESKPTPGQIIKILKDDFAVSTAKGDLVIEELQIEGKRKMPAKEFISGHKISLGEILGKK